MRYLWRFGYNRAASTPNPRLQITVEGHEEDFGHTWYIINITVDRSVVQVPNQQEVGEEKSADNETAVEKGVEDIEWVVKKRLCDLREELHDRVKERMGPAYSAYFDGTPFARHGGLPGTTARLRAWLASLAECSNKGALNADILAFVLRFLDAPVPAESETALLQAVGRCTVCTLLVEVPGRNVCVRCQMLRSDAVSTLQDSGAEEDSQDCTEGNAEGRSEDAVQDGVTNSFRTELV